MATELVGAFHLYILLQSPPFFNHQTRPRNCSTTSLFRRAKKGSRMKRNSRLWGLIMAVFLLILTQHVRGQANNLYTCWGGCYNKCFLLSGSSPGDQYPCYFRCLSSCTFTQSAGNFQYYCQIGCSATRCIPLGSDGANLEKCLSGCENACKV